MNSVARNAVTQGAEGRLRRANASIANRALELLGKELGMFVERSENRNVNYAISPEMLARGMARQARQARPLAKLLFSGLLRGR